MRAAIFLLIIVAGLFGCASRNPGSREQYYTYADSVSHTQLDTSCLQFNRNTQLRISSRLKEYSFSPPDSAGRQFVERIVYAAEEWEMADSTDLLSVSANTVTGQRATSSVSVRQEVIKSKTNRVVWWILIPVLILLVYLLRKLRRMKSMKFVI